jgi:hypothetical protein
MQKAAATGAAALKISPPTDRRDGRRYLSSSSPEGDGLDELSFPECPHDGAGLEAAGLGAAQLGAVRAGVGAGTGSGAGAGAGFGAATGAAGFGAGGFGARGFGAGLGAAGVGTADLAAGAGFFFAGLFFAALFLALAFLADFFGAAALDFLADFFADFLTDFLAFFAAFLAAFFDDFFAEPFFAVKSFFLFFFLFFLSFLFFFPLAIVNPPVATEPCHSSVSNSPRNRGASRSVQSGLFNQAFSIQASDRLSPNREAQSCAPQELTYRRQSAPCIQYCPQQSCPA